MNSHLISWKIKGKGHWREAELSCCRIFISLNECYWQEPYGPQGSQKWGCNRSQVLWRGSSGLGRAQSMADTEGLWWTLAPAWTKQKRNVEESMSLRSQRALDIQVFLVITDSVTHILWITSSRQMRASSFRLCACVLSHFSCVRLFATPWTAACQTSQSTAFPRQEYWSGFPFPSPGVFLT